VDNPRAYLASAELFTMKAHAEFVQCPTLITQAENDSLAAGAGAFFDALRFPKMLMRFPALRGPMGIARWRTAHYSSGGSWTGSTSSSRNALDPRSSE
jgi:hypothetical protein